MKDKLKAIAGELKKASAKHKGQAEKIEKLIKPKLSKLNKANRKKKAIKRLFYKEFLGDYLLW